MAEIMKLVEQQQTTREMPDFGPGDTIKVHVKVKEGDKERIQIFQGTVIQKRGTDRARHSQSASSPSTAYLSRGSSRHSRQTLPRWK